MSSSLQEIRGADEIDLAEINNISGASVIVGIEVGDLRSVLGHFDLLHQARMLLTNKHREDDDVFIYLFSHHCRGHLMNPL